MRLEFRKHCDGSLRETTRRHLLIPLACLCLSASVLAVPVPVPGNAPVPVDKLRPDNPSVLPMTGTWRFKLAQGTSPAVRGELPADTAIPDFVSPTATDTATGWKDIPVPANWEIEGFSMLTYQERPVTSHDIGQYRRSMDVPASFAGKTVLWHFDGAYDGADVYVNGQRCGYHESGFTAFNIDVTKAIKPGQPNLFAVRLYKDTSSATLDHGDFWCLGGIYRETYLVALPQLHVDDVTVVTDLDAQYKDATLKSAVRVAGPSGAHFTVACELYNLDGTKVETPAMTQSGDIGAEGTATVNLSALVTAPKLWNAEKPSLYYVFYRLSDGANNVERVQDRIGFRKIEMKNGVVNLNGVVIKFAGTCRHEEYSPYGHALTEQCWQTDIKLMKQDNINAIRTSHYNHAERFIELCDEAGFYILDEIPSCWVASEIRNASRTWAYTFRSMETLNRDKNRACVVAWSCGNESSYGVNNQAEFDYAKAHDPTRLALISQANLGQNSKTDFEDYHLYPFPNPTQIKTMLASPNRSKCPIILTEYGSGNDAQFNTTWDLVWNNDGLIGAFIWEWQAQGMYDKFPERWSQRAPGATTDAATGYRHSGGNGPVTADRKLTPMFNRMKAVLTPVHTTATDVSPADAKLVVPIQNRYSFTDLSELTCKWQALAGANVLASGESHIPAKARSTANASFPATSGMDTLRLEFIDHTGISVYVASLKLKAAQ